MALEKVWSSYPKAALVGEGVVIARPPQMLFLAVEDRDNIVLLLGATQTLWCSLSPCADWELWTGCLTQWSCIYGILECFCQGDSFSLFKPREQNKAAHVCLLSCTAKCGNDILKLLKFYLKIYTWLWIAYGKVVWSNWGPLLHMNFYWHSYNPMS